MYRLGLACVLVLGLADAVPGCFRAPRDPQPTQALRDDCPLGSRPTYEGDCEFRECENNFDCPERNCRETALCMGGEPSAISECQSGGYCNDPRARCVVEMRCMPPDYH